MTQDLLKTTSNETTKAKIKEIWNIAQLYSAEASKVARQLAWGEGAIKALPREDKLTKNVKNLLLQTGVVSGEFGLANEYIRRKNLLMDWLNDDDANVKNFTEEFLPDLDKIIENEQQRAAEDIELRKHQYGEDNSNQD